MLLASDMDGNSEHPLLTINAGAMHPRPRPQFVPKFIGTKKKDLHRIDASPYPIYCRREDLNLHPVTRTSS